MAVAYLSLRCSASLPPEAGNGRSCCCCGRRQMLAATPAILLGANANAASLEASSIASKKPVCSSKPDWYKELYAQALNSSTQAYYEKQIAGYKARLFQQIDSTAQTIVELGIGTGPNLKYYAERAGNANIIGVDPNDKMEKYAKEAASRTGLAASRFKFLHAVGEMLPLATSSIDSVVCTLVLCSVADVSLTLKEVKRVLRPGGCFLFIEHVAAQEGTGLRFWQNVFDPLQQLLIDGCHLTRDTLSSIREAKFATVQAEQIELEGALLLAPHLVGMAQV